MNKFYTTLVGGVSALFLAVPSAWGAQSLPFSITPTQDEYNTCTIEECEVDSDGEPAVDGRIFTYDSGEGAFTHGMTYGQQSDDYIWFPAVTLPAGTYKLTFDYKTKSDKENFAIVLSPDASSQSATVVKAYEEVVSNGVYTSELVSFEVTSPGDYNLGIHHYSPAGKWTSWYKNFQLTLVDPEAPKTPVVTFAVDGYDLTANIVLPSQKTNNGALTGTVTAVVSVDGVDAATVSGAPGAAVVATATLTSGVHRVAVRAETGSGDSKKVSEAYSENIRGVRPHANPMQVPYTLVPDEDESYWCTVINNNGDANTWYYNEIERPEPAGPAIRYNYTYANGADDYLILPATEFGTGAYEIGVNVGSGTDTEVLAICVADEPTVEALSANVIKRMEKSWYYSQWEYERARINVTEPGVKYIAFHVNSPAAKGYLYLRNLTVKKIDDNFPQAPVVAAEFDGGDGKLTVTLPAQNICGNPLTVTELTAKVVIDGDEEAARTVTGAPGAVVDVPYTDFPMGNHIAVATVTAGSGDDALVSDPSELKFYIGLPSSFCYELTEETPVELSLGQEMGQELYILDANNDGKTLEQNDEFIKYGYHSSNPGDDWAFTAPINITDITKLINLSIEAKASSPSYKENFEVWIGTAQSPEAMTQKLISQEDYNVSSFFAVEANAMIPEAGRYTVGIHVNSKANMMGISFKNLKLSMTDLSSPIPAKATDLAAVPAITGELNADVSFTLPTQTIGGLDLAADEELTATVKSAVDTKTVTGLPGAELSVNIATEAGENAISVVVSNSQASGSEARVYVTCGLDKPRNPRNLKLTVSDDNFSADLTWDPVTEGASGGPANPDGMFYIVWEWDAEDEDWYQLDAVDDCAYKYELSDGYRDQLYEVIIGIQAYNGMNSGSNISQVQCVVGKPYDLPMEEEFTNGRLTFKPISIGSTLSAEQRPEWGMGNPADFVETAVCDDNSALVGKTGWSDGNSYVILPKFSTQDCMQLTAEAMIYVYPLTPEIKLLSRDAEGNFSELATFNTEGLEAGWHPFTVALEPEYVGKKWVELSYYVRFSKGSYNRALFDSYKVVDPTQNPLGAIAAADGQDILATLGGVEILGAAGLTARVFTPAGQLVQAIEVTADRQAVSLAPGTYVVTAGTVSKVVAVK